MTLTRVAILVLGTHRGGTSVTAGLLSRAGCAAPRTPMPSNSWNETGYFESAVLSLFNDQLLRALGTTWDAYTRPDREWLNSDTAAAMRVEARELVRSEFGDAQRFVLKDPRICRIVPFWLQVFEAERVTPKAVLVIRPPFDVARSLRARDNLPLPLGALVWLRHLLEAEAATRTMPRTWAPYVDTLRDWRQGLQRMSVDLHETWSPTVDSPGDGFVNETLSHYSGDIDRSAIPGLLLDWLRRTEDAIECLTRLDLVGQARAMETMDAVREEFDRSAAPFGAADEPRYIECIEAAAAARDAVARAERLALERHRLSLERDAAVAACKRFDAEARDLTTALEASRLEVLALRSSMSWRVTAPLRAAYRLLVDG
jgi:hypothetical protein